MFIEQYVKHRLCVAVYLVLSAERRAECSVFSKRSISVIEVMTRVERKEIVKSFKSKQVVSHDLT